MKFSSKEISDLKERLDRIEKVLKLRTTEGVNFRTNEHIILYF